MSEENQIEEGLSGDELKRIVSDKDNRPRFIIYLDRLLWIILVGLVLFVVITAYMKPEPCTILVHDATGQQRCMSQGKYCDLVDPLTENLGGNTNWETNLKTAST